MIKIESKLNDSDEAFKGMPFKMLLSICEQHFQLLLFTFILTSSKSDQHLRLMTYFIRIVGAQDPGE